jgi:hypothetical protein
MEGVPSIVDERTQLERAFNLAKPVLEALTNCRCERGRGCALETRPGDNLSQNINEALLNRLRLPSVG